jgi:hypothetical protein
VVINRKSVASAAEKDVNEEGRSDEWPVYPSYRLAERGGHKSVYAPDTWEQIQGREYYRPLSSNWSGLFLKFANLAANESLDKHPLDSDKNEKVALQ